MALGPDRTPLEQLLGEAGFLRRLAAALVGPEASEDLVQETWRTALEHPPSAERPVRPWLARVARNLASNLRRDEARRRGQEPDEELAAGSLDPGLVAEQLDAQHALTEAVRRLEEPLRTTVVLRWFRGLDSRRIAALEGVPDGTVRWRLKQALERLRRDLDGRFGEGERWLRGIALVAGPALGAPPTPTLPSAIGPGVLLVNTTTKIALVALAATAALAAAWTWSGDDARPGGPSTARAATPDVEGPDPERVVRTSAAAPVDERRVEGASGIPGRGPSAPPRPCCVVGRVLAPDGRGLENARVVARPARIDRNALLSLPEGERRETRSDARGAFAIELPAHRPFLVRAEVDGLAPLEEGPVFAGTVHDLVLANGARLVAVVKDGDARVAGATVHLTVRSSLDGEPIAKAEAITDAEGRVVFAALPPGEASVAATFADRRAARTARLDGTSRETTVILPLDATGRLAGVVRAEASGEPIANAEILFRGFPGRTTDTEGRFALEGIGIGVSSLAIGARAPGYAARYEYVRVEEGRESQTVELRLAPAVVVTATVVDALGRPLADATVEWRGPLPTAPFVGEIDQGATRTAADGRFAIRTLHPGVPYRLLVLHRTSGSGAGVFACGPFAAGTGPIDLGPLALAPAGALSGTAGCPAPEDGLATVTLVWLGEDVLAERGDTFTRLEMTHVDPQGLFAFSGLGPGRYRVACGAARGRPAELWAEVELAPGELRDDLQLTAGARLVGQVVSDTASPLGDCRVRLLVAEDGRRLGATRTDDDGRFALPAPDPVAAPGPYRLEVDDPRLFFDAAELTLLGLGPDEIRVPLFPFRSAHEVRGHLVTPDGRAPEQVYVAFTDATTGVRLGRVALPEPDGTFVMRDLRDVPYDLDVADFSDRWRARRVPGVRPGGPEVELRLQPLAGSPDGNAR